MPYDPTPMGDDYFASIKFDERGNPYQIAQSGKRVYIPPAAAATAVQPDDPSPHPNAIRLVEWAKAKGSTYADPGGAYPKSGFASNRGTWDGEKGEFDGGNFINTSLGGLILGGGVMAAPFAAGALAGAGGAGAGTGATAAGIPTTMGIGSATSLGLPVTAGLGSAGAAAAAGAGGLAPLASTSTVPNTGALVPATSSSLPAASGSPSYLKLLEEGGRTATDIARGRAEGRAVESGLVNNDNRTATDLYRAEIDANNAQNRYGLDAADQENAFNTKTYGLGLDTVNTGINVGRLDLDQKHYALDAPGKRASNSVRGDILANAQDVSFDLPSTIPKIGISGGLRPSMFSANTRALGGEMSAQALAQQRKGDSFPQLPALPSAMPTFKAPAPYVNPPKAPTMQPGPQSNGFDTALNIAGYASLAAPYLKYLRF